MIIRSSQEIGEVLRRGKRTSGKYVSIVYVFQKERHDTRAAFTTSGTLRRAVDRNKIRRLMREAFRLNMGNWAMSDGKFGLDVVMVGNHISATLSLKDIEKDFKEFLSEIGKETAK